MKFLVREYRNSIVVDLPVVNHEYLMLDNELVYNESLDMYEMDHRDLRDLNLAWAFDEMDKDYGVDISSKYFVEKYNEMVRNSQGYGMMADETLKTLYDYLCDSGWDIETMLKELPRISISFEDTSINDILDDYCIDYEGLSESERSDKAMQAILDDDYKSYIDHTKTGILYGI